MKLTYQGAALTLIFCVFGFIKSGNSVTKNPILACYYSNSAPDEPDLAKFTPENINPYLCTHLIYAFGAFTPDYSIKPLNRKNDILDGGYEQFAKLKTYNPKLKTLLAIGGFNEASIHFSPIAADDKIREKFSSDVVKYLRRYKFDGLHIIWKYPGYREGSGPNDKQNFVKLAQSLHFEFAMDAFLSGKERLIITIGLPSDSKYVEKGFDLQRLSEYVDWFNIISYDYHTSFEPFAYHHAPLYDVQNNKDTSVDYSVQFYLNAGVDSKKLVVGVPTYGNTYSLKDIRNTDLGAPSTGPGAITISTTEAGFLAYNDICINIKYEPGWTVKRPYPNIVGPYAYKENLWVGYDDENTARMKASYILANNLGGAIVWAINFDDFRGFCGGPKYPFIEALKNELFKFNDLYQMTTTSAPPRTPKPSLPPEPSATMSIQPTIVRTRPSKTIENPVYVTHIKCKSKSIHPQPHPTNKSKYYICTDGPSGSIAQELDCPPGTIFNLEDETCEKFTPSMNDPIAMNTQSGNSETKNSITTIRDPAVNRLSGNSGTKNPILACYYSNWGPDAPGLSKFTPENINPYLCTHLIYAFAAFTPDYSIKPSNRINDILDGGYEQFAKLKTYNPKLKTLLAIGGFNEASIHFSPIAADDKIRAKFSSDVVKFLRRYKFDGLHIIWKYPGYREGSGPNDKQNLVKLAQNLYDEFAMDAYSSGKERLINTIGLPSDSKYVEKGFDLQRLSEYVDWFNIISYDYHTSFEPFAYHHAPLYDVQNNKDTSVDYSVQFYLNAGVDSKKLVVGVPTYGNTYSLKDIRNTDLGAPSTGPGAIIISTTEAGFLGYNDICYNINNDPGWTVKRPYPYIVGPYAYKGNLWVGYDDENTARMKANYIIDNDLGGALVWAINFDDFRGVCGGPKYPFIEALKNELFKFNDLYQITTTSAPPITPKPPPTPKPSTMIAVPPAIVTRQPPTKIENPVYVTHIKCKSKSIHPQPHPTNKSKYYICTDGPSGSIAQELDCPPETIFNLEDEVCVKFTPDMVDPVIVNPQIGISVTTNPITTSSDPVIVNRLTLSDNSATKNPILACYYSNWGPDAPGLSKFIPENINPYLCTHLIYAFAAFTPDYNIKPSNRKNDILDGGYEQFAKLKTYNPKLRTLLAIGGFNEASIHFSPIAADIQKCTKFASDVVKFLHRYKFDGIHIIWKYPGYREGSGPNDKANFVKLTKTLYEIFAMDAFLSDRERFIITIGLPSDSKYVEKGFDLKRLSKYVDWFNIISYDYHTSFEPFAYHHAPLHDVQNNKDTSVDYSVQFYLNAGVDSKKLVVGVPTYGNTYSLKDIRNTDLGAPSAGPGAITISTTEAGFLGYNDICYNINNDPGWTVKRPYPNIVGPYAYKGNLWVGYDDENTARMKANYILANNLGGAIVWAINFDDFRGYCGGPKYSFIEALKNELFKFNDLYQITTTSAPPITPKPPSTPKPSTMIAVPPAIVTRQPPTKIENPVYVTHIKCKSKSIHPQPHPTNKSKYYICTDGPSGSIAQELDCPPETIFNLEDEVCVKFTPDMVDPVTVNPQSGNTVAKNPMTTVSNPVTVNIQSGNSGAKSPILACYYSNWGPDATGLSKFTPENINPYLCTHLIYAFAAFTPDYSIKPLNRKNDILDGGYEQFAKLKTYNPKLKTLLAIGGFNEASIHFSPIAADDKIRSKFSSDVVKYLRRYKFDGLHIIWKYPGYREGSGPNDKQNLVKLAQNLYDEFAMDAYSSGKERLINTIGLPSDSKYVEKGFDLQRLSEYVDWFNIISYDYHTSFEPFAYHHAPLYDVQNNKDTSVDYSVQFYLNAGVDSKKLVVGVPTYGNTYSLKDIRNTDLGAPSNGPGAIIISTTEAGFLGYNDICYNINNDPGWTVKRPYPNIVGPYAYKGNLWVGYDDENTARMKANYILANNLGGALVWAINFDDFRGSCGGPRYPFIEALKNELFKFNDLYQITTTSAPPITPKPPPTPKPSAIITVPPAIVTRQPPTKIENPVYVTHIKCKSKSIHPQPHPTNKSKYYICTDGPSGSIAQELDCPPETIFNLEDEVCVKFTPDMVDPVIVNPQIGNTVAKNPMTTVSNPVTVNIQSGNSGTKSPILACYYSNWGPDAPGLSKFTPENINPYLCTHLIYAFAAFTPDYSIKPLNRKNDILDGGYEQFAKLKTYNPKLKTLLAIGGFNEASIHFSPIAADDKIRAKFSSDVVKFLRRYKFDGLHIIWKYPGYREGSGPNDKQNLVKLAQNLYDEFAMDAYSSGKERLINTIGLPSDSKYVEKGFDLERLSEYVDWFNIISYDYHTSFEPFAYHHAPLYDVQNNKDTSVDYSVQFYLNAGVDSKKLVVGVPTYGNTYSLKDIRNTDLGAPSNGPGAIIISTTEAGFLGYNDICYNINNDPGWTVKRPYPNIVGPYAYKGNLWVGYDDENTARMKANYILANNLGGAIVWAINFDDFRGSCGGPKYPFIEALKNELFKFNDLYQITTTSAPPITPKPPSTPKPSAMIAVPPAIVTRQPPTKIENPVYVTHIKCKSKSIHPQPHPTNKSKYYICTDGPSGSIAQELDCPPETIFNLEDEVCEKFTPSTNYPVTMNPITEAIKDELFKYTDLYQTTTLSPPSTRRPTPSIPQPTPNPMSIIALPPKISRPESPTITEDYVFVVGVECTSKSMHPQPHPTNKSKYYICTDGPYGPFARELNCPTNTIFNKEDGGCEQFIPPRSDSIALIPTQMSISRPISINKMDKEEMEALRRELDELKKILAEYRKKIYLTTTSAPTTMSPVRPTHNVQGTTGNTNKDVIQIINDNGSSSEDTNAFISSFLTSQFNDDKDGNKEHSSYIDLLSMAEIQKIYDDTLATFATPSPNYYNNNYNNNNNNYNNNNNNNNNYNNNNNNYNNNNNNNYAAETIDIINNSQNNDFLISQKVDKKVSNTAILFPKNGQRKRIIISVENNKKRKNILSRPFN